MKKKQPAAGTHARSASTASRPLPPQAEAFLEAQVGVHLRNVQKCLTATAESHFAEENRGSSEHPDFVVRVSTASWMHFLLGKTEHVVADQ